MTVRRVRYKTSKHCPQANPNTQNGQTLRSCDRDDLGELDAPTRTAAVLSVFSRGPTALRAIGAPRLWQNLYRPFGDRVATRPSSSRYGMLRVSKPGPISPQLDQVTSCDQY